MRRDDDSFELTEDHLALLRRMYVDWQDCETGAPEIDPKRPYGNSSVAVDVAEILGWQIDAEGGLDAATREKALALHRETQTALQIVLCTGSFQAGSYQKRCTNDNQSWALAGSFDARP